VFNAYDFTFAGQSASMFGMFLCDVGSNKHGDIAFGNIANIRDSRSVSRVAPIHYGVRYNDTPLSFPLIFGSNREKDRYEMQEIAQWLTGYQDYQWLSIEQPDLEHIQFRCLVQRLTPISVRWVPVAFEAKIICDCPYGYSYPFEKTYSINGETKARFYNDSTCREKLYPTTHISLAAGCTTFAVTNETTGETMRFESLPGGGVSFTVDNDHCVIVGGDTIGVNPVNREDDPYGKITTYPLYDGFNFQFLSFVPGDNILTFEGTGRVTFSGRYLYNVGA
jgi:hypothetical protein